MLASEDRARSASRATARITSRSCSEAASPTELDADAITRSISSCFIALRLTRRISARAAPAHQSPHLQPFGAHLRVPTAHSLAMELRRDHARLRVMQTRHSIEHFSRVVHALRAQHEHRRAVRAEQRPQP
ncbi:MAG: hypothetical protein M3Y87_36625, partial [Myxococcota bacterium]|nr:hypothetical protein [Myxococcota bacterium]